MAATEQSARASRALDDLYRHHAAEIFRYTYAVLGNHADAEDVTQATFVNALRALERGEWPRKPSNWLLVIAHNLIRQRFRQAQARPAEVALNEEIAHAAPERDDEETPSVDELLKALGRIPPSQREAIVMREFEGRPYSEISEILGITTSALETLLFRARRSLAEELETLVTCARAEEDVSRLLDGRLSRRERRRLLEHVRTCPSCARFEAFQRKQRRALKGLALLPLPASLMLFKGVHAASAAGLPTIGAGAGVTAATAGGGAASGGFVLGGLALTGTVAKVAAVVTAAVVVGGVSYEGVQIADAGSHTKKQPAATNVVTGAEKKKGTVRAVGKTRPAQAAQGKAHGKSAAAHERKRKLVLVPGRHHVPGGLVDVTGTPNENGNGGGPASGTANGDATRAHGTPSGNGANGRGAGSTKTSNSTAKAKTATKTNTSSGRAAGNVNTGSGKTPPQGKTPTDPSSSPPETTILATGNTPNGNANGAANGNLDPGIGNAGASGATAGGGTSAPADHGNDKK